MVYLETSDFRERTSAKLEGSVGLAELAWDPGRFGMDVIDPGSIELETDLIRRTGSSRGLPCLPEINKGNGI